MLLDEQPTRNMNILDQDYARAVFQAGGIPVPLIGIDDSLPDLVRGLDGFVFTGGDDIHPKFYGEQPLPGAAMTLSADARTRFELKLLGAVMRARKPVLAICHGGQLVNVALGGSLYQDIPRQLPRSIKHGHTGRREKIFHSVAILEGTTLYRIMGSSRIRVRSAHHQGIKNPGKGFRLSAVAQDHVVEAVESRGKNYLIAVQWHPEKMLTDEYTKKLFRSLVAACNRNRRPKR